MRKSCDRRFARIAPAMSAAALFWMASAALANDAAILECRKLSEPAQRLACYDALPATAASAQRQAAAAAAASPVRQQQPSVYEPIESHIQGRFEGWEPWAKIRFANGQVWQITDSSRGALDAVNPKVKVHRGALGSYFLEIEGTRITPRVVLVQ